MTNKSFCPWMRGFNYSFLENFVYFVNVLSTNLPWYHLYTYNRHMSAFLPNKPHKTKITCCFLAAVLLYNSRIDASANTTLNGPKISTRFCCGFLWFPLSCSFLLHYRIYSPFPSPFMFQIYPFLLFLITSHLSSHPLCQFHKTSSL